MKDEISSVQNGTYRKLSHGVGLVDTVNSNTNVTVYLSDRERFLTQYTAFAVKTAQATVEMCRVVYEAKEELSDGDFDKFCTDIGRKKTDSTIRKYLAIGEAYPRLINCTNMLPNSWTSIYAITQIPSDVFDVIVSTGNSMASLKGAQIKMLIDTNKKSDVDDSVKSEDSSAEADTEASDSVTPSTATDATTADDTVADPSADTSADDLAHAQQATASLLERVKSQPTASVEAASETYEVLIRFTRQPSDNSWWDLVEEIDHIVDKYNFEVDVIETRPPFVESTIT